MLPPLFATAATPDLRVPPGEVVDFPELDQQWETFSLSEESRQALSGGDEEGAFLFLEFPVAPGARAAIQFTPFDPYAPGAKMWVVENGVRREIPRSVAARFSGSSADGETRVGISFRSDGSLYGLVSGPDGQFRLFGNGDEEAYTIEEAKPAPGLDYSGCGTEHLVGQDAIFDPVPQEHQPETAPLLGASLQAVIAVDTDTALNLEKFSNNSTAALNWISDLFTALTTMYERDLDLTLLQGDTTLRTGSDPFSNTDTPASQAQLTEFGSFWSSNQGGIPRVFAMLLSGKSSSPNSASGIAWIDGYCENQSVGGGYSINQVFTGAFPADLDARLVGHELGHNAGSPHTHCYTPPVDNCFRAEPGCYSGSVSCPGGSNGTLMSYCNFSPPNGASCGQNQLLFHPTVQTRIGTFISSHSPGCITSFNGIFTDGFETGNTNAWSLAVP